MSQLLNPTLVINYLNSLLLIDPEALSQLIDYRVITNETMANHDTVQVLKEEDGSFKLGLLGILNGLCGIDDDGNGYIYAHINIDNEIVKFTHKDSIK